MTAVSADGIWDPEHPPFVEAWHHGDRQYVAVGKHEEVCVARWRISLDLCGRPGVAEVGDAWLCRHHYERAQKWAFRFVSRERGEEAEWLRDLAVAERWQGDGPDVVYYARREFDGLVKIGTSAGVGQRMLVLAREHGPLELLAKHNGSRHTERAMHQRFRDLRVEREWFRPEGRLLRWIDLVNRYQQGDELAAEDLDIA